MFAEEDNVEKNSVRDIMMKHFNVSAEAFLDNLYMVRNSLLF